MPEAIPLQPDLATRQAVLAKALARAQQMRDAEMNMPAPVTVGKQVVAPHWSQYLTPVLSKALGALAADRGIKDQAQLSADMQQQMQQWVQGMPTASDAAGPPNPDGTRPVQPATPQDKLAWATQGLTNPLTQALAQSKLEDTLIQQPVRAETNQLQRDMNQERIQVEGAQKLQQAIENNKARLQELQLRLEDRSLDRQSREALARESLALRAQIANDANQVRLAVANLGAQAKADKASAPPKLTSTQLKELDAQTAQQQALTEAINGLGNFKGSKRGTGLLAGFIQEHVPGGSSIVQGVRDPNLNRAIQQAMFTVDAIRHARFGSALSKFEKASAEQYLPSAYDTPEQVTAKLRGLQGLLNLNNQRLRSMAGEQPTVPPSAQYDAAPGVGMVGTDTPVAPPAPTAPTAQPGSLPRVRKYNPVTGTLE